MVFPPRSLPDSHAAEALAAFISSQVADRANGTLAGCHLVLLGLVVPSCAATACGGSGSAARAPSLDGLTVAVQLLRAGVRLVLLDRPRNRELIAQLLLRACQGGRRLEGTCQLEADLSAACRGADGVLLFPSWRPERSLPWGALAERLKPAAVVFDLRPDGCLRRPASCGLPTWQLGRGNLLSRLDPPSASRGAAAAAPDDSSDQSASD